MKTIMILGTGCPKCKKLIEITEKAVKELGIESEIIKVTDITEIMNYGVMMTPALVIDNAVKLSGRLPKIDELKKILVE